MLIKKIIFGCFIAFIAVFCVCFSVSAVDISAKSAVIIDANGNEIVFEKEAFEKRSMASTTKIMTAILAIESGKLGCEVSVTKEMTLAEGTSAGLRSGYRLTLEDLLYGMMLESGNDAANAVAIYLSGSLEAFSNMMNEKANEIGMKSTHFVTPSGLDDEEHYSTAYDMAVLASYCIKNPCFRKICSTKRYTAQLAEPENFRLYFSNHNRLLTSVNGVFGVKTGFTKKSGRCLVSAIEKDGAVLIAVTLSAPDDWNDHKKLYASCLEQYISTEEAIFCPDKVPVIGGKVGFVQVKPDCERVFVSTRKSEKITQRTFFPRFVYAPVKENDVIGTVTVFAGKKALKTVFLHACGDVEAIGETFIPKKSLSERIKEKIKSLFS